MKQINLWKMLGLYLVTLGVYGIVWMALRREELVKKHGANVPHWLWIVLPMSILFMMLFAVFILAFVTAFANTEAAVMLVLLYVFVSIAVVVGISAWWMWRFSKAVTPLVNGRITPGWMLAYWILTGGLTLFVLQFYVNRANVQPGQVPKETTGKPSRRFVAISIVIFLFALATNIPSFGDYEADYQKIKEDLSEVNRT